MYFSRCLIEKVSSTFPAPFVIETVAPGWVSQALQQNLKRTVLLNVCVFRVSSLQRGNGKKAGMWYFRL